MHFRSELEELIGNSVAKAYEAIHLLSRVIEKNGSPEQAQRALASVSACLVESPHARMIKKGDIAYYVGQPVLVTGLNRGEVQFYDSRGDHVSRPPTDLRGAKP